MFKSRSQNRFMIAPFTILRHEVLDLNFFNTNFGPYLKVLALLILHLVPVQTLGVEFSHIDCFLWLSIDHVLECRSVSKLRYSPSPSCHDIFTVAIPCGKGCWVATTSGNQPYPSSCEQHMMSQTVSLHGYNQTVNLFIFV